MSFFFWLTLISQNYMYHKTKYITKLNKFSILNRRLIRFILKMSITYYHHQHTCKIMLTKQSVRNRLKKTLKAEEHQSCSCKSCNYKYCK